MNMHKPILDACCGSRMFHFNKHHPCILFADNRELDTTIKDRGVLRKLEIKPDVKHDFTCMPYPDKTFKLVIFDPPHLTRIGDNAYLYKKYGRLDKDWKTQIYQGFNECMRVLDDFGTLVFKWNETQIKTNELLNILPIQPIIGHKSGKAAKTHWLLFMKGVDVNV